MIQVQFFARVRDESQLDTVGFYAGDIGALKAMGCSVHRATRFRDLIGRADLYFVWWWTWALPVVLLARLRRRPVFVTGVFNFEPSDPALKGYHSRPAIERATIYLATRLATANLFCSQAEYRSVTKFFRLSNSHYFPLEVQDRGRNGADFSLPEGLGDAPYLLNVAWSGKDNLYRKCVFEVVESFELLADQHPTLRLVLTGNAGDGVQALVERVRKSKFADRISYLGRVSDAELAALMACMAVFVSPSRFEGFGLAIAEAALVGKPVVTSKVGEVPYVLSFDGAQYCDGADPGSIADAVDACLSGGTEVDRMTKAAQRSVRRFSAEAKLRRLSELLETHGVMPR